MKPQPGSYELSPANGQMIVKTSREGVAGMLGHDLTLQVGSWTATVIVAEDVAQCAVTATADLASLSVVSGTGGAKPLSDKDRRDIDKNAQKALDANKFATVTFNSESVTGSWDASATVTGTLQLHGQSRQQSFQVTQDAGGFRLTGTLQQTQFGIKPFSAMLGALKLADPVEIEVTAQI